MDRIQQSQPGTLNAYWERDGVATDPGTVTATILSDRTGVPIATGVATTGGPGTSRTLALTPAQTANLDYLTISWTATDGSVLTTYAEVVGDFMFTIQFARTRSPLQDQTMYPLQALLDYRTLAEMALEDICGVAFVPRYSRDVVRITGPGLLEPSRRRIRNVIQITSQSDAGPVALTTLNGLRIEQESLVFMPTFFNWWSTPMTMAYEHGFSFTPPRVRRAALELCRRWIVESPWDERTTGFRTRDGGEMTILTANHTDAFDLPEVVAVADAYSFPMVA